MRTRICPKSIVRQPVWAGQLGVGNRSAALRRRDGNWQQRGPRFGEQAFPVGFAPEKGLVGVDAVQAGDPCDRCAGLQGFFNDRPLQRQRVVAVGTVPLRRQRPPSSLCP